MTSVWGVIPAAGSGRRKAAEMPKQYLTVAGTTLLEHTLRALLACPDLRGIVMVLDPADRRADSIARLSDVRTINSSTAFLSILKTAISRFSSLMFAAATALKSCVRFWSNQFHRNHSPTKTLPAILLNGPLKNSNSF